jgi:hypothetical protein
MATAKANTPDKILLGYGLVSVDGEPLGLTRGGSTFTVEREVRNIEADGDRGTVKGRVVIDTEEATLVVNALEIFSDAELSKYFPALDLTTNTIISTLNIVDADYRVVVWEGKTLDGKSVTITLPNAINKGNLDLTLEDKDEVVPELEFTGAYLEESRDVPGWTIEFEAAA